MAARILAIMDRGADGTAAQYADLLDFCVGLRTSFGSMDLILRGSTVTCALSASEGDNVEADTLSYSARRVRALVRTGSTVWADDADLAGLGCPVETVIDGVITADADALAVKWRDYEEVWFL